MCFGWLAYSGAPLLHTCACFSVGSRVERGLFVFAKYQHFGELGEFHHSSFHGFHTTFRWDPQQSPLESWWLRQPQLKKPSWCTNPGFLGERFPMWSPKIHSMEFPGFRAQWVWRLQLPWEGRRRQLQTCHWQGPDKPRQSSLQCFLFCILSSRSWAWFQEVSKPLYPHQPDRLILPMWLGNCSSAPHRNMDTTWYNHSCHSSLQSAPW